MPSFRFRIPPAPMTLSRLFWLTTLTTTTFTTLVGAQEPSARPSSAASSVLASASSSATTRPNWGDIPDEWDRNNDGSPFVWLIEDDYKGKDFFECVSVLSVLRRCHVRSGGHFHVTASAPRTSDTDISAIVQSLPILHWR
jgi:hypothetical protein